MIKSEYRVRYDDDGNEIPVKLEMDEAGNYIKSEYGGAYLDPKEEAFSDDEYDDNYGDEDYDYDPRMDLGDASYYGEEVRLGAYLCFSTVCLRFSFLFLGILWGRGSTGSIGDPAQGITGQL